MEILIPIIKAIHIIVAIVLIIVVLLQPGKGGDLGSVFGGGTSESVFGASGAVPFLTKLTRLFAVVFFITSLSLGYFSVQNIQSTVIKANPGIQEETGSDSATQEPAAETGNTETANTVQQEQGTEPAATEQNSAPAPETN